MKIDSKYTNCEPKICPPYKISNIYAQKTDSTKELNKKIENTINITVIYGGNKKADSNNTKLIKILRIILFFK